MGNSWGRNVSSVRWLNQVAADCIRGHRVIRHVLISHRLLNRSRREIILRPGRRTHRRDDVSTAHWGETEPSVSTRVSLLSCDWLEVLRLGPLPRVRKSLAVAAVCCVTGSKIAVRCVVVGKTTINSPLSRPSTAFRRLRSLERPS